MSLKKILIALVIVSVAGAGIAANVWWRPDRRTGGAGRERRIPRSYGDRLGFGCHSPCSRGRYLVQRHGPRDAPGRGGR